jgi:hypothetical protein
MAGPRTQRQSSTHGLWRWDCQCSNRRVIEMGRSAFPSSYVPIHKQSAKPDYYPQVFQRLTQLTPPQLQHLQTPHRLEGQAAQPAGLLWATAIEVGATADGSVVG